MGRPPVTVLAIDQGTTSTRALLVDAAGRTRIVASLPHRQIYPGAGMVEHDPEALLANLRACLDAAGAIAVPDAVGIDNQGESCLAWDADTGRAVSPVLVWQDDRTRAMAGPGCRSTRISPPPNSPGSCGRYRRRGGWRLRAGCGLAPPMPSSATG